MKNYEVILEGFDGSTSDTDHFVKWLRAPSMKAVKLFLGDFPLYSEPSLHSIQTKLGHEDGIDVILNAEGKVVSWDFKLIDNENIPADRLGWTMLIKTKR
ncbi:hypothetical protein HN803_04740 [candidate division WWE3 bacterium]|jgi:hypothetical protein|nr:hypothetical protein [Candidatus Scalindua sp.]MBT7350070.1 hypothetical protein [candidate division WWE3 bacterium]